MKELIDAERGVPLELPRVLQTGVIERDRSVDIPAALHIQYDIRHLGLIGRQEPNGDIL